MKKMLLFICLQMAVLNAFPYSSVATDAVADTVSSNKRITMEDLEFLVRGIDRYKIYPTENIYNVLKLDTRTGKVYQVQWSLDKDEEFTITINNEDLSYDSGSGTFELYPTKNMYQFLLLDKVTGRVWHVQWSTKSKERWIRRIYNL